MKICSEEQEFTVSGKVSLMINLDEIFLSGFELILKSNHVPFLFSLSFDEFICVICIIIGRCLHNQS
jgi:hypothetical protein